MDKDIPFSLQPNGIEHFSINNADINIPKCSVKFKKWNGAPMKETFGGKAIIDVRGKPMFAELAIANLFIKSGWQARWIETYGKGKTTPIFLSEWRDDKYRNQILSPITDQKILDCLSSIARLNNNSYMGCWDIIGWKDENIIFAESKRLKRDSIRKTQNNWLTAGLQYGLRQQNFLIVEWDFES